MVLSDTQTHPETRPRTISKALLITVLAAAAITVIVLTALIWGRPSQLPPGALFTTDDDGSVSLIDTDTGEWLYQVPDAALAPDRSALYQAAPDGEETVLTVLDPITVEERQTQRIPGRLQIRVVSPQGEAVALMAPRANPGLYVPEPRDETEIYVARTDGSTWRRYVLEGNYEPEAFSVNTQTLFLLEFLPALKPDHYEVISLDLETGAVINDYTPEVDLDTWMKGHARGQVMSPDGKFLYTLYSIDRGEDRIKNPADPDGFGHFAFIHVISLEEEWSFCIFLPVQFGRPLPHRIASMGLAVSPDGAVLAAIDHRSGTLIEVDTLELAVERTTLIGGYEGADGPVPLAIGPDGVIYAAYGSFVQSFEPENRTYAAGMEAGGPVRSMDLSADGKVLRVAVPGRIHVIDLATGEETGNLVLPETANQVIVGPATKTRFEVFTCAC